MVKPLLDVNEVLTDPYFADEFTVSRREQVVDASGLPSIVSTTVYTAVDGCIGVVTPSSDSSLVRTDAYEAMGNSLQVITTFRLQGATRTKDGRTFMPDLVGWGNQYYIVRDIKDFTRFGAGFCQADCLLIDYESDPPE